MGLDMYLSGKRFISETFNKGDNERAKVIADLFPELDILGYFRPTPIKEVTAEVGYWRQANAIHQWFVKNVQSGEDDCNPYFVDRNSLETLRELCQRVLADRSLAAELLPPQEGFFFGSQDIDDYYFEDLENTISIIDRALALPEAWDFEYRSSW